MDASSPLAAMHRQPTAFGGRLEAYRSNPHVSAPAQPRGAFNIRAQFKASQDYFGPKNVHGSSPAGSLAADLCQNFRIGEDGSPRFPTPRRSLFSANLMTASSEGRHYVTTPPLPPSSSPGYVDDMMDISPLEKNVPMVAQIEVHSPTPVHTPDEDMLIESPIPLAAPAPFLEPPKPFAIERRKPILRRPSLSRAKGYTTSAVLTNRLHADNQLPPFRFGGESRVNHGFSPLSLGECFDTSPSQDRRPQTANSPCGTASGAMRPKPQFSSLSSATGSRNASPALNQVRRPSNPFNRPRRQYRRSLSMFENPGDMIKPKKEESPPPALAAVMDMEEPHELLLPHFFPEGNDSIPRIDRNTLLEVLDGKFNEHYDQKMVIDCRFEYEFEGGHVNGASNFNDKELLSGHLFGEPHPGRTLLIFHCEYSAHRAPMMARHIRAADRTANVECYPKLTYPEVYILDGGYSGLFAEHPARCYPQAYVEMDAAEHAFACERGMGRLRQNRKGLGRAQTFAFGEKERSTQESPTAAGREFTHESPSAVFGSPVLGGERCHARRMASY